MITESGDLVIVAVQRDGQTLEPGEIVLAAGDAVLVRGTLGGARARSSPPTTTCSSSTSPTRCAARSCRSGWAPRRRSACWPAMVVLLATGAVPAAVAALLAAGALVVLKVITVNHAFRAVSWTTVVLVGGMLPLSLAMQQTGAAEQLATGLTDAVGDSGSRCC